MPRTGRSCGRRRSPPRRIGHEVRHAQPMTSVRLLHPSRRPRCQYMQRPQTPRTQHLATLGRSVIITAARHEGGAREPDRPAPAARLHPITWNRVDDEKASRSGTGRPRASGRLRRCRCPTTCRPGRGSHRMSARSYSSVFSTLTSTREIDEASRWAIGNDLLQARRRKVLQRCCGPDPRSGTRRRHAPRSSPPSPPAPTGTTTSSAAQAPATSSPTSTEQRTPRRDLHPSAAPAEGLASGHAVALARVAAVVRVGDLRAVGHAAGRSSATAGAARPGLPATGPRLPATRAAFAGSA